MVVRLVNRAGIAGNNFNLKRKSRRERDKNVLFHLCERKSVKEQFFLFFFFLLFLVNDSRWLLLAGDIFVQPSDWTPSPFASPTMSPPLTVFAGRSSCHSKTRPQSGLSHYPRFAQLPVRCRQLPLVWSQVVLWAAVMMQDRGCMGYAMAVPECVGNCPPCRIQMAVIVPMTNCRSKRDITSISKHQHNHRIHLLLPTNVWARATS